MKKAFDSVSKHLILLCWQQLGVPLAIEQWLVDLDDAGYTIVRTPFALERWDVQGFTGVQQFAFNPERGTGQDNVHSPFTWLAVFDVPLTVLEKPPPWTTIISCVVLMALTMRRGIFASGTTCNSLAQLLEGFSAPRT
eukprot:gene2595-biopygen2818